MLNIPNANLLKSNIDCCQMFFDPNKKRFILNEVSCSALPPEYWLKLGSKTARTFASRWPPYARDLDPPRFLMIPCARSVSLRGLRRQRSGPETPPRRRPHRGRQHSPSAKPTGTDGTETRRSILQPASSVRGMRDRSRSRRTQGMLPPQSSLGPKRFSRRFEDCLDAQREPRQLRQWDAPSECRAKRPAGARTVNVG